MVAVPLDVVDFACGECGTVILMTRSQMDALKKSSKTFHCLNGHARWWPPGGTDEQKKIAALERDLALVRQRADAEKRARIDAEKALTESERTCDRCSRVFDTVRGLNTHARLAHKSTRRLPGNAGPDAFGADITRAH